MGQESSPLKDQRSNHCATQPNTLQVTGVAVSSVTVVSLREKFSNINF